MTDLKEMAREVTDELANAIVDAWKAVANAPTDEDGAMILNLTMTPIIEAALRTVRNEALEEALNG